MSISRDLTYRFFISTNNADVKVDSWPAYEAVGKYLETAQTKRLLLLIGNESIVRF